MKFRAIALGLALFAAAFSGALIARPAAADPSDYTLSERLDHLYRLMKTGSTQLLPKLIEVLELARTERMKAVSEVRNPVLNERLWARIDLLKRDAESIPVSFWGIRERDRPRYDELVREIGALYPDLDAVDYEARSGAARARLGNEFDEQIVQCRKSGGAENFFLGTCKQTARIVWHVSKELIPILRREAGLLRYFASQYDDSRIRDAQAATQGLLESFGKWKKTLDPIMINDSFHAYWREHALKFAQEMPAMRAALTQYSAQLARLP